MANKADIVLNDGLATPVARTFTPLQSLNDFESWSDKESGISIGQPVITLSIRRPSKNLHSNKVRVQIALPTLEVTSANTQTGYQPVPKVAFNHLVVVEFICPDRGTLAERTDLLTFMSGALFESAVRSAVLNAEMPY